MALPKLIDNMRVSLGDTLKNLAPNYTQLSIATGYWDIPGTAELIDLLQYYDSIRLLIGQEPISFRYQKKLMLDLNNPDSLFPGKDFESDMVHYSSAEVENTEKLRKTTTKLCELIKNGRLQVKIYRRSTLHAKAYIFDNQTTDESAVVLGSSNFTKAGMFTNTELNTTEDDRRIIRFRPQNKKEENGYISWFETLWNDDQCVDWDGEFRKILENSPLGPLCYGPYDSYIKTLMEVYPDELVPPEELEEDTSDILYSFQNRNAGILINKLNNQGVAILADSVGLGKTITAGAVIKHYLDKNEQANILIIAPASLKKQWQDDLVSILHIDYLKGDYQIVSEQDTNAIREIYDEYTKSFRRTRHIDLFVIDEAHNLRSSQGDRHDSVLDLLQQHPNAHVLLLTATPVNNSLIDIANILQLGSKGKIISVNVSYPRPNGGGTELIDFFEALKRIQTGIKKAEKEGDDIDVYFKAYKPTIHEGLRHYLVRSTRQGVEAEGGIIDKKTGKKVFFPKSIVSALKYQYSSTITQNLFNEIGENITKVFEGIDPRKLNLSVVTNFTQQSLHPLDFLNAGLIDQQSIIKHFGLDEGIFGKDGNLYLELPKKNLVHNILQLIFVIGFVPYRPDVYQNSYYGKSVEDIRSIKDVPVSVNIQLTIHNIMQITWMKRMESSAAALLYSVDNFKKRITLFEKYLDKGFIVNLVDAVLLESDYGNGEDIEQAFEDYEAYLKEKEAIIEAGGDPKALEKQGVEKKVADPHIYNIKQIRTDLERDKRIISLMESTLDKLIRTENDPKIHILHDDIKKVLKTGKYGKKVLVFSFFADTIKYLKDAIPSLFSDIDVDFVKHSGFIYGQTSDINNLAKRFSPHSKHYEFKSGEEPIDFLFSTDVLSEGQNLQDAGYLINYDLHWNPVRMIQRNGRVNRLGSSYSEVLISNMCPMDELELYLNLVLRLERKIKTIRNTIGLDQGVLDSSDVNPIEFVEKYYENGELPEDDDSLLSDSDKHIFELRKFLGNHPVGSPEFKKVANMPEGKWNYLPATTPFNDMAMSMVKVYGQTAVTKKKSSQVFFLDITDGDFGPKATYIEYTKALNAIKTTPEDNERTQDYITLDRTSIINRAKQAASIEYQNPTSSYKLTPQYIRALETIAPYVLNPEMGIGSKTDLQGTIQKGVTTTDVKRNLEKNLREVNKEQNEHGSIYGTTVDAFIKIFNRILKNVEEDREASLTKGVLNYAKR